MNLPTTNFKAAEPLFRAIFVEVFDTSRPISYGVPTLFSYGWSLTDTGGSNSVTVTQSLLDFSTQPTTMTIMRCLPYYLIKVYDMRKDNKRQEIFSLQIL